MPRGPKGSPIGWPALPFCRIPFIIWEREASSDPIAEDWDRVALMVARKTEGWAQRMPERESVSKVDQIEELMRIVGEPPPRRPEVLRFKRRRRGR